MTRKQLEFFLKTAELQSVTRAAREFYISQPSLSEQIRKLEEELGVELFTRSNRTLTLTVPGEVLVHEAQELLAKVEELRDAVRLAGKITNRVLRICFLPGPFTVILPEIVHRFNKAYPEYQVELADIDWNTLTQNMTTNNYDVAFYMRIADTDFPNTEHIDLVTEKCYYTMSENHPLANRSEICFEDIEYEIFCVDIKPESHNTRFVSLYSIFESHGKKPNVLLANDMAASLMVIRSSMAIGVASPNFLIENTKGLKFISSEELPMASLAVYWHKQNDNPAIAAFVEIVQAYVDSMQT